MTKSVRTRAFQPLDLPVVQRSDTFAPEPGELETSPHPPVARDVEGAIHIIAVDDDPDIREQLADTLGRPSYELRLASTAVEFFKLLDGFEAQYAIIDLSLPVQDGIDIVKQLRDRSFAGEVILISGTGRHVLETTRRIAADHGLAVLGVLPKPFTANELVALLDPVETRSGASDSRIRKAIAAQQIRPYFQPKVSLKTGKITGAEALSRWHHPDRGILMPAGYMKAVRSAGSQSVHDYRILECTLALCAKINATGRHLQFSVNFSVDDVQGDYFLDVIKDALTRHSVEPNQLMVEITETEAVDNLERLAERLLKLRLCGCGIAIDDFGTGHSSLSRIQRLPVSEIKIDRSFISGLSEYSEDYAIVRSVIDLSHSFGCPVVAEGVESIECLAVLHKLGCDAAQGFLFSPAVNEKAFCALIDDEFPALVALQQASDTPSEER